MRLPFTVYDGKKKRPCTYEDLFIIVECGLDAEVFSKEKEYWFFNKKLYGMGTIVLLYASIKSMKQTNLAYSSLMVVDSSRIHSIKCKDLHKWMGNPMIKLIMLLEGI